MEVLLKKMTASVDSCVCKREIDRKAVQMRQRKTDNEKRRVYKKILNRDGPVVGSVKRK